MCPYCDEEGLEDSEREALGGTGEELVEVFHSRTQTQADFITSMLEAEGIPTFQTAGEPLGGGRSSGRGRGVSIQVAEEDAGRARDLIESAKEDLETDDN